MKRRIRVRGTAAIAAAGMMCSTVLGCRFDDGLANRPVDLGPWRRLPSVEHARSGADVPPEPLSPQGERRISLDEVLERAASEAVAIAIARQRAVAALANESVARSAWLPTLSPGGTFATHDGRLQATEGDIFDVDRQSTFLGVGLRLRLSVAEALYGQRAAKARSTAAIEGIRTASNDVLFEASRRYYDLLESRARVEIAQQALLQAGELLQVTDVRVRQGAALEADRLRAQARRAETLRDLIRARSDAEVSSAALAELLLMDEAVTLVPDAPLVQAMDRVPEASLAELLGRAHRSRPELAQASARIEAAKQEERKASRGWMVPQLRAAVTGGGFGDNFGDLGDREDTFVGLGWDLSPGLFGSRRAATAARKEAERVLVAVEHIVAREVVQARRSVMSAREQMEAAAAEVAAARGARDQAASRHMEGAALLIEVLDAEVGLTRSQTAWASATADYNRAQFSLLRAIGATSGG